MSIVDDFDAPPLTAREIECLGPVEPVRHESTVLVFGASFRDISDAASHSADRDSRDLISRQLRSLYLTGAQLAEPPDYSSADLPSPRSSFASLRMANKLARRLGKTAYCFKGHPQTPANVYKMRDGHAACRACHSTNVKAWVRRNREKDAAHKIVAFALRAGLISRQPCEVCGSVERVHAHHDDYKKPLAIRWLCVQHHLDEHHPKRSHSDVQ